MDKVPKKEVEEEAIKDRQQNEDAEEKPSKSCLQQKTRGKRCALRFKYKDKAHGVSYDASHTVIGALQTNPSLKATITKELEQREIVFIRADGNGAAVNTDFPCVLLQAKETLKITFIRKKVKTQQPLNANHSHHSEVLLSFNIKTKGGDKVKLLMRNNTLVTAAEVDYVCVYAVKRENFQSALKRDKRFGDAIFRKSCALSDSNSDTIHQMSEYVDDHNGKQFKIIVNKNGQPQQDSQDSQDSQEASTSASTMTNSASSDAPENTGDEPRQQVNTKQSTSEAQNKWKQIPGSHDIMKLLRDQFQDLLQQLKRRENLRNNADVEKFLRAEYDKSVESFLEVKKVREIMTLCSSVCQIRVGENKIGTGFLLFHRFILTNGHVYFKNVTTSGSFTAVFGYEDLDNNGVKKVPIKGYFSYFYDKDEKDNHLDYALLELESVEEIAGYPELLPYCRPKTLENGSLICIVGHPEGGVKKMDPCFVIGKEKQTDSAVKHRSENVDYYHVISQKCLTEKWGFNKNQISYNSCFFYGSSGSPVFDADSKLIGIHTGGYVYKNKEDKIRSVMEYAYAMQPILDDIKAKARIKGMQDIVNIIEGKIKSNATNPEEQQNQTDVEMEEV